MLLLPQVPICLQLWKIVLESQISEGTCSVTLWLCVLQVVLKFKSGLEGRAAQVWRQESSELFICCMGDPTVKRMEMPSISLEIWQSSAFREDNFCIQQWSPWCSFFVIWTNHNNKMFFQWLTALKIAWILKSKNRKILKTSYILDHCV